MTVEEIQRRIAEDIESKTWDDETAHANEDGLRHEVLEAIAAGADNAAELAQAVLETSKIKFARWCA